MRYSNRDVVVVGAGISGLVCAYRLKQAGADVLLLEKSNRVGGVIQSEAIDGFLIERGPNSSQGTEELLALVDELGISGDLIEGDPRAPAFVCYAGALHPVPSGPHALVTSTLLSPGGKLRLIAEPFVRKRREQAEESVASFARRRIGRQAAERLVAPFVSGVYAGDAEQLSVQAAFPRLANLESGYGGLFRGMLAKALEARRAKKKASDVMAKATPTRRRLVSFKSGMAHLPRVLSAKMGEDVVTGVESLQLQPAASLENSPHKPDAPGLVFEHGGNRHQVRTKQLVIAAPSGAAAALLTPVSSALSAALAEITYAQLAIVHLSYGLDSIERQLDGFGFLVVPGEQMKILGCVWNSSLFEGRAPRGRALLTVFVGGARAPELTELPDAEMVSLIHADLQRTLGVGSEPKVIAITRYRRAIPQYNLGHAERVRRIEGLLEETGWLSLVGNYLHGVSTGDCVKHAEEVAARVASSL